MGEFTGLSLTARLEKADLLDAYKGACKEHDVEQVVQILKKVEIHPQDARQAAEELL